MDIPESISRLLPPTIGCENTEDHISEQSQGQDGIDRQLPRGKTTLRPKNIYSTLLQQNTVRETLDKARSALWAASLKTNSEAQTVNNCFFSATGSEYFLSDPQIQVLSRKAHMIKCTDTLRQVLGSKAVSKFSPIGPYLEDLVHLIEDTCMNAQPQYQTIHVPINQNQGTTRANTRPCNTQTSTPSIVNQPIDIAEQNRLKKSACQREYYTKKKREKQRAVAE